MSKKRDPLSRLIAILYRQEQSTVSQLLSQYDIAFSELPLIMELYSNQGVSQEYLAQKVQIDKANAARSLKQLEKKALITRERCPHDARAKLVYPTHAALDLKPKLVTIIDQWNALLTQGITQEELELVAQIQRKMINNVFESKDKG